MIAVHDVVLQPTWGVTCGTCRNQRLATPHYAGPPTVGWDLLDRRAAHLARTGVLAPWVKQTRWVHREKDTREGWAGDFTGSRGLMLALVAHHHQRGLRFQIDKQVWEAVAFLTALGDHGGFSEAWDSARLVLATAESSQDGPVAGRHDVTSR